MRSKIDPLPPAYHAIPPSSSAGAGLPSGPAIAMNGAGSVDPYAEKQALRDEQLRQGLPLPIAQGYYRDTSYSAERGGDRQMQQEVQGQESRLQVSIGSSSHPSTALASGSSPPRERKDTERQRRSFTPASPTSPASPAAAAAAQEAVIQVGLGPRGHLPQGMDVRDALAQCEDPTLGWSLRFWITISDPLTQHVFFACPATGQCSWDPPVGAFVVPRSPDGEWWELADATRSNRSYYYNTLTGKTQWTRPGGDAFVIPLGLIQRNALPARPKPTTYKSHSQAETPVRQTPSTPRRASSSTADSTPTKTYPLPPRSPGSSSTLSPSSSIGLSASQTLDAILRENLSSPTKGKSQAASPQPERIRSKTTSSALGSTTIPLSSSITTISEEEVRPPLTPASLSRTNLTVVEETSGNETDRSDNSGAGWWERRKSTAAAMAVRKFASPRKNVDIVRSVYDASSAVDGLNGAAPKGSPLKRDHVKIGAPAPILERRETAGSSESDSPSEGGGVNGPPLSSDLPNDMPQEPIYVEHNTPVQTKRLSTGLHPLLPTAISSDIQSFQGDDFARKYFATKRSGMLRQKVPVERIMEWQRSPITAPLLVLSRSLARDAIITFKVIQHVMGERDRAVEGAKPMQSSSSHLNLASLALGGRKGDEGHPSRGGRLANGFSTSRVNVSDSHAGGARAGAAGGKSEKMIVLDEIRWMIQLCVTAGEMRDEVYSQLVKQLTKNPDHDAMVLGFQLFCVLVNAFGPSKNFEPFVKSVLQKYVHETSDGVGVMANYCIAKLDVLMNKGLRAKALTIGEIEHASDAAFYPSVYGESLDRIMDLQKRSYPSLKVPVILPFLADGILALGGMQSEGIFRVPGDGDSVSELRSRMDRGHYQLKGIDDPHVAASLFKLWLRELEEPLVPSALYNEALSVSRSPEECVAFVGRLPTYNRRVLLFVVSFIRLFMQPEVVGKTKMTPGNLALVMAPNILRTTSNSLVTVFTNSSFESKFILQLLEHMDPAKIDPDYVPAHGQAMGRV